MAGHIAKPGVHRRPLTGEVPVCGRQVATVDCATRGGGVIVEWWWLMQPMIIPGEFSVAQGEHRSVRDTIYSAQFAIGALSRLMWTADQSVLSPDEDLARQRRPTLPPNAIVVSDGQESIAVRYRRHNYQVRKIVCDW
jgi:hypothetical protein